MRKAFEVFFPPLSLPNTKLILLSFSTMTDAQDLRSKAFVAAKSPFAIEVEAGKTYYWCTCGMSKNQPFCDGAHVKFNEEQNLKFAPLAWTAEESKTAYFCGCKKTKNPPMCDGTHAEL